MQRSPGRHSTGPADPGLNNSMDSADSRDWIEGQAVRVFQLAFFGDPDYAMHELGITG